MTHMVAEPVTPLLPRWAPWLFLGLMVLPFHPFWLDFEQVRRGALLLLAGASLLLWPRLPRLRGENSVLVFQAMLLVAAVISIRSLQPWEAVYRLAHWLALLVVLRLGAAAPQAFASPLATMLALTSAFGILQRLGLAEIAGYGVEREPVSVFGNLNVASEWTAIAAMAVAVLGTPRAWLGRLAIVCAAVYLVTNQSRSGMFTLPIGLCLLLLKRRSIDSALPLVLALAGGAVGFGIASLVERPPATDAATAATEQKRATATLDVRFEIARSCAKLFDERPLFGWGPGQFQVQYPRVRSPREIELSSHGRQFATEVRTAHDDWLELLVEGGLPILVSFAAMLFALQRGARDKTRLLPLFVLLLLMFVRAPLGNAPAVAAAFLLVGSAAPRITATSRITPWALRAVGLLLVVLGALPVISHCRFVPYQAAVARGDQPPRQALHGALAWMWWEPRWWQLLAQEHLLAGELSAARRTAATASTLRPHDPQLCLQLGEALARDAKLTEAAAVAAHALAIDPANPELRVLLSTVQMQRKDVDGAIAAVVDDPHPTLRAQLANHFRALEALARELRYDEGEARCAFERSCLSVQETISGTSAAALATTTANVQAMFERASAAGELKSDLRPYLLAGVHYKNLGRTDEAARLAARAAQLGIRFPAWQRSLLGDVLKPLIDDPTWQPVSR